MKEYLIYFIQVHLDFRLPEFESLCATFNIPYEILGKLEKVICLVFSNPIKKIIYNQI